MDAVEVQGTLEMSLDGGETWEELSGVVELRFDPDTVEARAERLRQAAGMADRGPTPFDDYGAV